jgi:hypothetical protein
VAPFFPFITDKYAWQVLPKPAFAAKLVITKEFGTVPYFSSRGNKKEREKLNRVSCVFRSFKIGDF